MSALGCQGNSHQGDRKTAISFLCKQNTNPVILQYEFQGKRFLPAQELYTSSLADIVPFHHPPHVTFQISYIQYWIVHSPSRVMQESQEPQNLVVHSPSCVMQESQQQLHWILLTQLGDAGSTTATQAPMRDEPLIVRTSCSCTPHFGADVGLTHDGACSIDTQGHHQKENQSPHLKQESNCSVAFHLNKHCEYKYSMLL